MPTVIRHSRFLVALSVAFLAAASSIVFQGSPADAAPQVLSNTRTTAVTSTSADIAWTTDIATCAQINYGTTSGALNRQIFESPCSPGIAGAHSATLSGLSTGVKYYYQVVTACSGCTYEVSPELDFTTGGATPLAVSNINVVSVGPTTATITWSTNKVASGQVEYGLGTTYELPPVVQGGADSTSHSVQLNSLSTSTTYHFRVRSTAGAETATSSTDRTFTTSAGSGTTLPQLTSAPRVDATNNQASVTFNTNVPTGALIEYERTPSTTLNALACDDPANCTPPPPRPNVLALNHTVTLSGLTAPSQTYRYKITIIDSASNVWASSEFTFNTSAGGDDHVFTTGGCNDGTPIGQCNAAGLYCDIGGGDPFPDCRVTSPCPTACTTATTCQQNGRCTVDPALGSSPTQCNQLKCYQKCDANSGSRSGKSCTDDSGCIDTVAGVSGKCTVGGFNNPAVAGCFSSWPKCDANTILKVLPDRVCDKWLTCKTSLAVTSATGKTENQCFNLTICDSISPNGQCNNLLEGGQCDNDPLRFCKGDADCLAGGRCRLPGDADYPIAISYNTPADVGQIRNLSGYVRAGLDWGNNQLPGDYPYSLANQIGQRFDVPDGTFEETTYVGSCSKKSTTRCSSDQQCIVGSGPSQIDSGPCKFEALTEPLAQSLWQAVTPTGSAAQAEIHTVTDGTPGNLNTSLQVIPTNRPGSGVRSRASLGFFTTKGTKYIMNVRLKSTEADQPIQVSMINSAGAKTVFDDTEPDGVIKLSTNWHTLRLGPVNGEGGQTSLQFLTTVAGDPVNFFVDDISITPALQVNASTFLPQDCRIFPGEDSPSCRYTDENGVLYRGLRGYCLERDPLNSAVCLSWWPVDIVTGDNIFLPDEQVGYQGRRPLYACLEGKQDNVSIHAQGFASNEDDGRFDGMLGAPDANYVNATCSSVPLCNHWSASITQQDIRSRKIKIQDVQFVRLNFAPGAGDWGRTMNYQTIPDGAIVLGKANGFYYMDVYPNPGTDGDFSNSAFMGTGKFVEQGDDGNDGTPWDRNWIDWVKEAAFGAGGGADKNGVGMRIWSTGTNPTDELTYISIASFDDSGGDYEGSYNIYIALKPYCTKLIEVAGHEDKVWLDRTSSTSTYVVPDLNYRINSDLGPFATIANPDTVVISDWPKVLFEGPNLDFDAPNYQVRGGGAYACTGTGADSSAAVQSLPGLCGVKRCQSAGPNTTKVCYDTGDCSYDNGSQIVQGTCAGNGNCLKYNATTHRYDLALSSKTGCVTSAACAVGEECVGGAASYLPAQAYSQTDPVRSDNTAFSEYRLMRLFAQAYSEWEWNSTTSQYQPGTDTLWSPPAKVCRVCTGGGTNGGKACTSDASCGADGPCGLASRHPSQNANPTTDSTADYCAIPPRVKNVNDGVAQLKVSEGGIVLLKFNSQVDREQAPLTRITIDWGDGSVRTEDTGLSIAPREDPQFPHVYAHPYDCGSVRCEYTPKIQIQDNWGWCSDGSRDSGSGCNSNQNSTTFPWTDGLKVIVED